MGPNQTLFGLGTALQVASITLDEATLQNSFSPIVLEFLQSRLDLAQPTGKFDSSRNKKTILPRLYCLANEVFSIAGEKGLVPLKPLFDINVSSLRRDRPGHMEKNGVYFTQVMNFMNLNKSTLSPFVIERPGVLLHPVIISFDGQSLGTSLGYDSLYNNFNGTETHYDIDAGLFSKRSSTKDALLFVRNESLQENAIPYVLVSPGPVLFSVPVALFLSGKVKGTTEEQTERHLWVKDEVLACYSCSEQKLSGHVAPAIPPDLGCPNHSSLHSCTITCACTSRPCICPCDICRNAGRQCERMICLSWVADGDPAQGRFFKNIGEANTLFLKDPDAADDNVHTKALSDQCGLFDCSHLCKTLRNPIVKHWILVNRELVSSRMLLPLLDDSTLQSMGITEGVILAEDKMCEKTLMKLVEAAEKIWPKQIIFTRYPNFYGDIEGLFTPHGDIYCLVALPILSVDFFLAPVLPKSTLRPGVAPTLIIGLWRCMRTAKVPACLLMQFNLQETPALEPISLALLPTGKKGLLIVLFKDNPQIYILEHSFSTGAPNSKKRPSLVPLRILFADIDQNTLGIPNFSVFAMFPGTMNGIALSNQNSLYTLKFSIAKDVKKSACKLNLFTADIPDEVGNIQHVAAAFDLKTVCVASSTGIYIISVSDSSHWTRMSHSMPSLCVGMTFDGSVYCVTETGDLLNVKTGEGVHAIEDLEAPDTADVVAADAVNYVDGVLASASAFKISTFSVAENSLVVPDGPNIRIVSNGSSLQSLLRVILLLMQSFGYAKLDGDKNIKLPEGLRLLARIKFWFSEYEEQTLVAAGHMGISSVASLESVDGVLTSASRRSIMVLYDNLSHLYLKCVDLKIEDSVFMRAFTSVRTYGNILHITHSA